MASCPSTGWGSFLPGFTDREPLPPMAATAFCLSTDHNQPTNNFKLKVKGGQEGSVGAMDACVPHGLLAAELGVVLLAWRVLGQARRLTRQRLGSEELVHHEMCLLVQSLQNLFQVEDDLRLLNYLAVERRGCGAPVGGFDGQQRVQQVQRCGREVPEGLGDPAPVRSLGLEQGHVRQLRLGPVLLRRRPAQLEDLVKLLDLKDVQL